MFCSHASTDGGGWKADMKEAGNLVKALSKSSAIISHVRNAIGRLNSELKMIQSILDIAQTKLDELDSQDKPSLHERNLLKGLCDVPSPSVFATDHTVHKLIRSSHQAL